ncbi:MAG TPA: 16S rRNA (cytidine(1402)-2'-O)-methyltransferase [Candidatus Saccharimonadia bacterium]|nr:16S rRNA (cytidine(1402)-2'-O)-methyltransferase [Candidatus Saccharimonadia bacterium]
MDASTSTGGTLWIVATPIGNLADLSPRAIDVLRSVAAIAAEDTRTSRTLLQRFGIATATLALHEHNEEAAVPGLVARLARGESLALISDAGTPLVSDPGYRLVAAARAAGIRVSTVPGPCALVAALSISGLPSDRFAFEGFLPAKGAARRARLESLAREPRTLVFYESKHRIGETLADLAAVFGAERSAALARELTKLHETVLDGTLAAIAARVASDAEQRLGEFVLVVAGAPEADEDTMRIREGERTLRLLLEANVPASSAAKLAAAISGAPKNALYRLVEQLRADG